MREVDELRPLTALQLLTIRHALAETEEAERALWGNAEVLSRACLLEGERVFPDAGAVLSELTVGEMETLLECLWAAEHPAAPSAGVAAASNPAFDGARFTALKEGRA